MPAGQTCPTPPPPAQVQWVSAPLTDGGYAQCRMVGGCHSIAAPCPLGTETFPPTCTYPNIIANKDEVRLYAWNGVAGGTAPYRYIGAFWPIGQFMVANVGAEGWIDEWGGVAPVTTVASASPLLLAAALAASQVQVPVNLDGRYEAVAVRRCLTPNPDTGSTEMSMSGISVGEHYVVSKQWAAPAYKKLGGVFVGARPVHNSGALGMATVPEDCLRPE